MSQNSDCTCTPSALEVPVYGLKLSLDEQALKSLQSPPVIGAGMPVGVILLLPFRKDELPQGWHFCNGAAVSLDSAQGRALNALPAGYKADWGITTLDGAVTLPNLFSEDGRGCFLRSVDGVTRQVGAVEEDAIRNITGDITNNSNYDTQLSAGTGCFTAVMKEGVRSWNSSGANARSVGANFDASRVVPTAEENRPLNLGMTPAVYLGV